MNHVEKSRVVCRADPRDATSLLSLEVLQISFDRPLIVVCIVVCRCLPVDDDRSVSYHQMSHDCTPDGSSCSRSLTDVEQDYTKTRANPQLLAVIRHAKRLDEVEELWRDKLVWSLDPPLWSDGPASVSDPYCDLLRS